uniref:Uncharacterized protein n=1 Tax=Rhodopseudomonas palustris (strain BisA53) TaxID=316055 RepID=Q07R21_RHOP5
MPSPEWIWGIAIVVLAIAVAYGLMRNSKRTAGDKRLTEAATKENYRAQNREDRAKPMPE